MHTIEPYYNWRGLYIASEDPYSPFYGTVYSEFQYSDKIYNYYIHPQWDDVNCQALFLKVLYVDYDKGFTIIEFIGEWNDCIDNDIMKLKRDFIDLMIDNGIDKFILIGENVLNFHASDDCYYEEWFDDVPDGWICLLNFREHVIEEFADAQIDQYLLCGKDVDQPNWRTMHPNGLFEQVRKVFNKRLV